MESHMAANAWNEMTRSLTLLPERLSFPGEDRRTKSHLISNEPCETAFSFRTAFVITFPLNTLSLRGVATLENRLHHPLFAFFASNVVVDRSVAIVVSGSCWREVTDKHWTVRPCTYTLVSSCHYWLQYSNPYIAGSTPLWYFSKSARMYLIKLYRSSVAMTTTSLRILNIGRIPVIHTEQKQQVQFYHIGM